MSDLPRASTEQLPEGWSLTIRPWDGLFPERWEVYTHDGGRKYCATHIFAHPGRGEPRDETQVVVVLVRMVREQLRRDGVLTG